MTKSFLKDVDAHVHELSVTWHTFDLETTERKAKVVLEELRARRNEVADAARKRDLVDHVGAPR